MKSKSFKRVGKGKWVSFRLESMITRKNNGQYFAEIYMYPTGTYAALRATKKLAIEWIKEKESK